jgi:hypothetical protein
VYWNFLINNAWVRKVHGLGGDVLGIRRSANNLGWYGRQNGVIISTASPEG